VTPARDTTSDGALLGPLKHFTARHRWWVIGVWIVLTVVGGVSAGKLSSRWYQSLSVPGGDANWWMPEWTRIALRIPHREPAPPEIAAEVA
jgi:hypothetical protein